MKETHYSVAGKDKSIVKGVSGYLQKYYGS